jgi:hypothetical protein
LGGKTSFAQLAAIEGESVENVLLRSLKENDLLFLARNETLRLGRTVTS